MDLSKVFTGYTVSETDNEFQVTCVGDVAGSLAGANFTFGTKDSGGVAFPIQPYIISGGFGEDPTKGTKESDAITNRADAAGDLASTYFTVHDGESTNQEDYIVWYKVAGVGFNPSLGRVQTSQVITIADIAGIQDNTYFQIKSPSQGYFVWYTRGEYDSYNPKVGRPRKTNITPVKDNAGSLNNTYFKVHSTTTDYYVWYNVNGAGADPSLPGYTGIEVILVTGASANQVMGATMTAINFQQPTVFSAVPVSTTIFSITNLVTGVCVATTDGLVPTGFTIAAVYSGVDLVVGLAIDIGIGVRFLTGDTADTLATRTAATINAAQPLVFSASVTENPPTVFDTVIIVNRAPGLPTAPAADGNTNFAITTPVAGVDGILAIAGYSTLAEVDVALNAADTVVSAATAAAISSVPGWFTMLAGNQFLLIHKTKGNCTDTADGDIGAPWAVSTLAGTDPNANIAVPVVIAHGDNDHVVAAALQTALTNQNFLGQLINPLLHAADVFIYNRWKGTVTAMTDGAPATGFTLANPIVGSVVTSSAMNVDGSGTAVEFAIKPGPTQVLFIRKSTLFITGMADWTKFGSRAALVNGCVLEVVDLQDNVIKTLATVKTNADLAALGQFNVDATGNLVVNIDMVQAFSNEIGISGVLYYRLRWLIQDNLSTLAGFTSSFQGHYQDISLYGPATQANQI